MSARIPTRVREGADAITIHIREEPRHIKDPEVRVLRETVAIKRKFEL